MLENHCMGTQPNFNAQKFPEGHIWTEPWRPSKKYWDGPEVIQKVFISPSLFYNNPVQCTHSGAWRLDTCVMSLQSAHKENTSTYTQNSYRHLSKIVNTG